MKRIVLAVTGSISAYKSIEVCRNLVKKGHEVKVILTRGALEFVKERVYLDLGASNVYMPDDDFKTKDRILHIDLAKWCDKLLLCPLSANTLSNLVNARAFDLLSTFFLAYDKEVIAFPAMNTVMYNHPFVKENLDKLSSLANTYVVPADEGLLACGDTGIGKLPEVAAICDLAECLVPGSFNHKQVVITTGATKAPLDPVRFLTNDSTGITGYHLAKKYLANGYQVKVIAGENSVSQLNDLIKHPYFIIERVKTTKEMHEKVMQSLPCDIYISSAAICDIAFEYQGKKIKKSMLGEGLKITQDIDILKAVLGSPQRPKQVVGFAAETNTTDKTFKTKLKDKPVDLLIGNPVHNGMDGHASKLGFGQNQNTYYIMGPKETKVLSLNKDELAQIILKETSHAETYSDNQTIN